MRKSEYLKKGMAVFLAVAMVAGLVPDVGKVQVRAEAAVTGYTDEGFCEAYEWVKGKIQKKADGTCNHENCSGYEPAPLVTGVMLDTTGDGVGNKSVKAYAIGNAGQMYWFSALVNGELTGVAQNKQANAYLTQNIVFNQGVLNDEGELSVTLDEAKNKFRKWNSIGKGESNAYGGIFDGKGHEVQGLFLYESDPRRGLFGQINGGTYSNPYICNLGVVDSYVSAYSRVGGICGYSYYGKIYNCYNKGRVESLDVSYGYNVGGICGAIDYDGEIINCYNTGNIYGSAYAVGGVCGQNNTRKTDYGHSSVEKCYNTGKVTGRGDYVGGVCGRNGTYGATLADCYNAGEVTGNNYVGGVVGQNNNPSILKACYNVGIVEATGADASYIGAICGSNESGGTVLDCCYRIGTAASAGEGEGIGASEYTTAQFESGEVCYQLNGETTDGTQTWYQRLNIDAYPRYDAEAKVGGTVYKGGDSYANSAFEACAEHQYNAKGLCSQCGAAQSITITNDSCEISNYGQLLSFAKAVNGGKYTLNAKLTADIVANENLLTETGEWGGAAQYKWTPIGENEAKPYKGTFDGQGHTISGLFYKSLYSDTKYVGLFGCVKDTKISNVGVIDSYFSAGDEVGGVCGEFLTSSASPNYFLKNCYSSSRINAMRYNGTAGGVCGTNVWAKIENCYATGKVSGANSSSLCGFSSTDAISNCYYLKGTASRGVGYSGNKTLDIHECTQEEFTNGKVTYSLNKNETSGSDKWYQNLEQGTRDSFPVLNSSHGTVYESTPCKCEYSNTGVKNIEHSPVFTVDDENHSVTASCDLCNTSYSGAVTLTAPENLVYDGTDKGVTVSGKIDTIDTPEVVYEKDGEAFSSIPKDIGTYKASITYTDAKGTASIVSVTYTITSRPVTVTADDKEITYGAVMPEWTYTVAAETPLPNGEQLHGELACTVGEEANAGTYEIGQGTLTDENNPNYTITFTKGSFTIHNAETTYKPDCDMVLTLGEDNKYTATITAVDGAEYKFDNGDWSTENTLTDIAPHTEVKGYIRIAAKPNYNAGAESSKTLTSGHAALKHQEKLDADCEKDGNVEYWYCGSCQTYYSDAACTTEINKESVTIPKTGHDWDTVYVGDGEYHWHPCKHENCPYKTDNSKNEEYAAHSGTEKDGICDTCNLPVNKFGELQIEIQKANAIVKTNYSDMTVGKLEEALAATEAITINTTDEVIEPVLQNLKEAYDALKSAALIVGTVANPSSTGKQTGGGRYAVGETVTLTADGVEGWTFNGWYDSKEKLVSDKAEVTFTVTEGMSGSVAYTAKYTHVSHTMDAETHKCSECGTDYYMVTFTGAVTSETYTTGNVEFPAGDYIFKVGDAVIDTADYTVSENTTIAVESLAEAAKYAVTITGDAHCTLTVTDSNGNTVVNGDTVAAGTILKVSVKVDDGYTLTTAPESSYTVSEATTITAETKAKTYAVTVDDTYYKSGEADAPTASVDALSAVPYGTSLTLTAADANEGYEFLGWYQTNGKQLTAQKEYTVTITSALTVQPRYQKSSGTVTFVANGSVVGTFTGTSITEENLPETPVAPSGYEFDSWDKTITEINTMLADNNNVTVTATFKKIANSFTVSVYNGNATEAENTAYEETTRITVTAEDVADMNFAYWTLNGEIQSYNKTIAFYASSDCVLKAVYSDVVTTAKGTATLQTGNYDISTKRLSMVCYLTVPDGCTMVKAGVVAASGTSSKYNAQDELTMDNADYVKTGSNLSGLRSLTYTWIKSNVSVGDTWYARAYVTYTDSQNNTVTVYGDRIILNAGTDYDYSEKASAKINSVSWDASTKRATFVSYITVPDGTVMKKAGVVAANSSAYNPETAILTTENASYVKSGTNLSSLQTLTYTWIKSNVSSGDIWYARAYVIYTDESGNSHTVYGNIIKYQAE